MNKVGENFFALGIVLVTVVLFIAYLSFGLYIAIRASYVLFGLAGAAALLRYGRGGRTEHLPGRGLYPGGWRVTIITFGLAVTGAALLESRLLVLLLSLPFGYAFLVGRILSSDVSPQVGLGEACVLFAVGPVTKYVATGVYIGNTDLLLHLPDIERFVRAGGSDAIIADSYSRFPGLHVFVGEFSMLGDLAVYDALLVTGIIVYVVSICLVYLLARYLFSNRRIALFVALAATLIHSISYYATYFYPQALATVLLLFFVFLIYRTGELEGRQYWRTLGLALVVFVPVVFIHHFTFVLFFPVLVSLLVVSTLVKSVTDLDVAKLRIGPFVLGYALAVSYWLMFPEAFLLGLQNGVTFVLDEGPLAGSTGTSTGSSILGLGTRIPETTTMTAVYELLSPIGVYYTLLVLFFSIGLYASLRRTGRFERALGAMATGVASSAFVFQTPLIISGAIRRIRLPMSFFFVFIGGVGMYHVAGAVSGNRARTVVVLLVLLGTMVPLVAADDLASLDSPPKSQAALTGEEYAQLRYASEFIRSHDATVSSLYLTKRAMEGFDTEVDDQATVEDGTIHPSEKLFLYREAWDRYRTSYHPSPDGPRNVLVISSDWLDRSIQTEHKVYAGGTTGMLWSEQRSIGPERGG